jgi:hypothetical protein
MYGRKSCFMYARKKNTAFSFPIFMKIPLIKQHYLCIPKDLILFKSYKMVEYGFIHILLYSMALTVAVFMKLWFTEYVFMNTSDTKFNPNRN